MVRERKRILVPGVSHCHSPPIVGGFGDFAAKTAKIQPSLFARGDHACVIVSGVVVGASRSSSFGTAG